jgi:hypothetical protein
MASNDKSTDTLSPELVMKARMAHHALHSPEGFDLRTAILLSENGLLPEVLETFQSESYILAAIRNPDDVNRIQAPMGPLVAVKSLAGGEQSYVVTVAEFLLSDSQETRSVSVEYLENLASTTPPCLTERSRAVLVDKKDDLLSIDAWPLAAVGVLDALDQDFLYNLAGLRQSLVLGHREGMKSHMQFVLHPTLPAINALPLGVGTPSQERETIIEWAKEVVRTCGSITTLCNAYYSKLGHLPLTGELSLGAVVRQWVEAHIESQLQTGLWEGVWAWADVNGGPLARYHACQVFSHNPAYVPQSAKGELWKEILEILLPPGKEAEDLKWNRAWRLQCELLRHYAAHFECLLPGEDGERVAAGAMWVTERVATVLLLPTINVSRLLEETVIPTGTQTRGVWQMVRPPVRHSQLRYAALFSPSLWSLSILAELGRDIRSFTAGFDAERGDDRVNKALMIWLLLPRHERCSRMP